MKYLVIIPARGGSKGIPYKNIKILGSKPLIQYTIEAAQEVFSDESICVSTDDEKIKKVVESLGLKVPFLRPEYLATDLSGTYEVLVHVINEYKKMGHSPEVVVLLQPTSPLRSGTHIKEALNVFDDSCDMVVSVKKTKSNPYSVLFEENTSGWLEKVKKGGTYVRRQDYPEVWELNGAIYIMRVADILTAESFKFDKARKFIMDEIHSIDIDNESDWVVAEWILNKNFK